MFFFRTKISMSRKTLRSLPHKYTNVNHRAIFFSLKPPQTYDTFCPGQTFQPRRVTKKKWISRGDFFATTKKLKLYWFYWCFWVFHQLEKNEILTKCHQEKGRLHWFMKHMGHRSKRAKSSENATRVRSENFVPISESLKTIGFFLCKNQLQRVRTKKQIFNLHILESSPWIYFPLTLYYI